MYELPWPIFFHVWVSTAHLYKNHSFLLFYIWIVIAYFPFVNHLYANVVPFWVWIFVTTTTPSHLLVIVLHTCLFGYELSFTASHLLVIVLSTQTTIFCMNCDYHFSWVSYCWILYNSCNWGFVCEFLAETDERICFLNVCPDEVIRSLFFNKNNDSLITVSVYASENFSSLKCRSTKIECVPCMIVLSNPPIQRVKTILLTWSFVYVLRYIRRGTPDAGFPLFQSESLKWPGFVEFDDVNGKVLTYSAQDRYLHHSIVFLFQFYCFASV